MRDNLGLNVEERSQAGYETPRDLKRARNLAQSHLRQGLSSLPAPKNDFDIVVDDEEEAEAEASTSGIDQGAPLSEEEQQSVMPGLHVKQPRKRPKQKPGAVKWCVGTCRVQQR